MTLHTNMIPFFVLTALLGIGYLVYTFRRVNRVSPVAVLIGAAAGLLGPLIFMVPLESCTFEPERSGVDYGVGIFLFFVGAVLLIGLVEWVSRLVLARSGPKSEEIITEESSLGKFRLPWFIPWILLAPTLAILVVFIYYPAIETFRLSTLLTRIGAPRSRFVCVRNFTELIDPQFSTVFVGMVIITALLGYNLISLRLNNDTSSDAYSRFSGLFGIAALITVHFFLMEFWSNSYTRVYFNTIFISGLIVIIGLILALAIAYLVFQPISGAGIYRTLLIWPYAISPPIAGILFLLLLDPTIGLLDHLLSISIGVRLPNYRQDAWLARWAIIMASVWKTLGYNILFYIAGLQNVSKELVEAAAIDGANAWQRFRNVIIPALSPITFFLIITNLTYAFFETFGTIDYLTKGAPAGATSVAIFEIVQVGVIGQDLGRGAAQSIILFMMVITVTFWQFRTSGRRVSYGA